MAAQPLRELSLRDTELFQPLPEPHVRPTHTIANPDTSPEKSQDASQEKQPDHTVRSSSDNPDVAKETPADRYRQLIEQLRDDTGDRWGWKKDVADLLGIDATLPARFLNKERNAGSDSIEKAINRLGLRSDFFYGDKNGPKYRDYLKGEPPELHAPRAAHPNHVLAVFLKSAEGQAASSEEVERLKAEMFPPGRSPTLLSYHFLLQAYRAETVPDGTATRAALATEDAYKAYQDAGGKPLQKKRKRRRR